METNGDTTQAGDNELDPNSRDLAFKLLAAHALVDPEFYAALKADPRKAARKLHIKLTDEDVALINAVDWATVDKNADTIRTAISPAQAAAGPLW